MTNSHFTPILKHVFTIDDADTLVTQIDQVLNNLYATTNVSINQLIDQNLSIEIGEEIKKAFLGNSQSFEHQEDVKSFFLGVKEELANCKIMTLTLAYQPTIAHIRRLKNWCIANIKDPIIFEIQYEPEVIAGAVIVFNGHYLDYSLKKKLDDYFSKEHIRENPLLISENY